MVSATLRRACGIALLAGAFTAVFPGDTTQGAVDVLDNPVGFDPLPLGKAFERESAGISLCPPKNFIAIAEVDREEIVRFVNDVKKPTWTLSLTRRSFPTPQHLFAAKDKKGDLVPGIVENTLEALKTELPGCKVLRAGDPTNVGTNDVGMLVMRYTKNGERRLAQHAIIEGNDQLFYLLAFNSPGRKDNIEDANAEEKTIDPGERQAVETFRAIVDSVKLLDLGPVREDQKQRLFRTRTLYYNLTERKITAAMIPEQYLRIVKEGHDIGYSYVVEQQDRKGAVDGVRVGIRTRLLTGVKDGQVQLFPREDSESWMFMSMDRRREDWSKITVWDDDGKPKSPENPWRKVSEVGTSQFETRNAMPAAQKDPNDPLGLKDVRAPFQRGDADDPHNPWVEKRDKYTLNVQFKATRRDLEPVQRSLPPFYMPQALGAMLPRLLPTGEAKTYMVATYVSEFRQVMLRYIDVGPEADLPPEIARGAAGARGVPISDRIGYEGAPTVHWVTKSGVWMGSVTKSTGMVVSPIDEATLRQLWSVTDTKKLFELPRSGPDPEALDRVTGSRRGDAQPSSSDRSMPKLR